MSPVVGPVTHPSGWDIHAETTIYDSPFVRLAHADVTGPHGYHVADHHVIRIRPAAGVVAYVDGRVLLLWRHRFITRTSGWEVPAGRIEDGETPMVAAARECVEESGWRPGPLTPLLEWAPLPGIADSRFHAFLTTEAEYVGPPADAYEAERIAWVPPDEIEDALEAGELGDGFAVPALLMFLRRIRASG